MRRNRINRNLHRATTALLCSCLLLGTAGCASTITDGESAILQNAEEENVESGVVLEQTTESITAQENTTMSESISEQTEESAESSISQTEESTNLPEESETAPDGFWNNTADISWIDPQKPMVAFTFDDGPVGTADKATSMRIQKALSDNGQHATFFYCGISLTEVNKQEIRLAQAAGFEIGNHTWDHKDLTKLSEEDAAEDIEKMRSALEEITGQKEFLLRAPYVATNATVLAIPGVPFVNCGMDSQDWNGATAEEIIKKITDAYENGKLANQIVLMHETYSTTAEAVEYLVPFLVENGYQVVTVSELFQANSVTMKDGTIYSYCKKP